MGKLFGREVADDHPAMFRLDEMESRGIVGRAVACNLHHDARVGEARDAATGLDWVTADRFKESYAAYYETEVRRADIPDFLKEHNWQNVVYGKPGEATGLHGGLQLVRLINISGLHVLYSRAKQEGWIDARGKRAFATYPADEPDPFSTPVVGWVQRRMESDTRRADLIGSTLRYMNERLSQGSRFHPVWVTALEDFPTLMHSEGGQRWPEMLGLGHWMSAETWWFAVSYPVETVGNLAVPTVLDSGLNAFFFPTPLETDCGYAADLYPIGPDPVREWIHTQCEIDYNNHWEPVDRLFGKTHLTSVGLEHSRFWHWTRLKARWGAVLVQQWMPQPL